MCACSVASAALLLSGLLLGLALLPRPADARTATVAGIDPNDAAGCSTQFYFAYGSNLNDGDWSRYATKAGVDSRALRFRFVGVALLPSHEPRFTVHSQTRGGGVLDVVERADEAGGVAGGLFEIDAGTLELLDEKEGAPHLYERRCVTVRLLVGSSLFFVERRAVTYAVVGWRRQAFVRPHATYADVVVRGLVSKGVHAAVPAYVTRLLLASDEDRLLFVYGSLRRGGSANALMAASGCAQHERTARLWTTRGALVDVGAFPALLLRSNGDGVESGAVVVGELWHCETESFAALDAYEDAAGDEPLYRRVRVRVTSGGERRHVSAWAWAYVMTDQRAAALGGTRILSGDWLCGEPDPAVCAKN
jgi:gamma-glutamylcyclotransferase (GGCT)/AIG2-like uncharacterized protein YtfP